ncbi:MAG TPA: serine/threonine-protein kinase [Burkholderiales bacterium]|nr:serine/threonine-protein kinase [Burkholderiales bacterium]
MRSIGRYMLDEELGRGSMGTVFRASDPLIERSVAIKTVDLGKLDDGTLQPRLRFLREAKAAGRLSHPGIVTVHDVGELEDVAFIVMELVEGRSVKDALDRGDEIPLPVALDIVRQAAEALDFAHRHGVVHRDVKPGNLMLTRQGMVKITDFGIARVDQTARTRTGILVGSPGYMSPEQLMGKAVDGRSDVFSLGAVLYELATGRGPFDAEHREDVLALMNNITNRLHTPASRLNPKVPASLDAIVDRALAKKPADRYESAGKMAAELRALADWEVRPVAGEADIAKLAANPNLVLPEFDLFAATTPAAPTATATIPVRKPGPPKPASAQAANGLLSRLRQEAEQIEVTGGQDDTVTASVMRRFDVERRMRTGLDFYQQLVRYLGIVKPEISHLYWLDGVGGFVGLKVADAFVDSRLRRDQGRPWLEAIMLTVVAIAPTTLQVECAPGETQVMMNRLATANLRYQAGDRPDAGAAAALNVAGEVTMHVRIMADRDRGRIAFLCRNVAQFGPSNFVVDAAAVPDTLFEEFANYLLGQPSKFPALAGRG